MQNEHVLSGLVRKRADLSGQIEHTQSELRKLVADLDAIDAAIRIFDPAADVGEIKARRYPPRHAAFRGEMMRFVMGSLRVATGPLTSLDIADVVMKGRGLSQDDAALTLTIRKRVGACLNKLKHQGVVTETAAAGGLKGWVRT